MSDDIDLIKQYLKLREQQGEAKETAEAARRAADELEQKLLDRFASNGIDKMTIGGATVYLHRQLWASQKDGHDLVAALRKVGLHHMVSEKCNTQTLSAYVREVERDEGQLPAELEAAVNLTERYSLRVRRAG